MIVQAFLRWAETARAGDRAKAAQALGRAYLTSEMSCDQRRAAGLALTYLLDDASPRVRLAMAEALAGSAEAPRGIILALAEDQPEIAGTVIMLSPVLTEEDLVDLVGRGSSATRCLIASRPDLGRGATAAIAEIGDEGEVVLLLENGSADITRLSLRRIAERHGKVMTIRNMLLDRPLLPVDARHMLVSHVADVLLNCGLVRATLGNGRIDCIGREAHEAATVAIATAAPEDEMEQLVEHLRRSGKLTPAFLIHALCLGQADFVAKAVASLSGLGERRVRPILATGRMHAVRALFESCGLSRDIAGAFTNAVFFWRDAAAGRSSEDVRARLLNSLRSQHSDQPAMVELVAMVDKLHRIELRETARAFASQSFLAA